MLQKSLKKIRYLSYAVISSALFIVFNVSSSSDGGLISDIKAFSLIDKANADFPSSGDGGDSDDGGDGGDGGDSGDSGDSAGSDGNDEGGDGGCP